MKMSHVILSLFIFFTYTNILRHEKIFKLMFQILKSVRFSSYLNFLSCSVSDFEQGHTLPQFF